MVVTVVITNCTPFLHSLLTKGKQSGLLFQTLYVNLSGAEKPDLSKLPI